MKIWVDNQWGLVLESQSHLSGDGALMFGLNDIQDAVNRFIKMTMAVQDHVIKFFDVGQLLAGGLHAGLQALRGFSIALLQAVDQFLLILAG